MDGDDTAANKEPPVVESTSTTMATATAAAAVEQSVKPSVKKTTRKNKTAAAVKRPFPMIPYIPLINQLVSKLPTFLQNIITFDTKAAQLNPAVIKATLQVFYDLQDNHQPVDYLIWTYNKIPWYHGNYGKGLLSRSEPKWVSTDDRVMAEEPLQLSPYETLFLHSLGCLDIHEESNKFASVNELWELFTLLDKQFQMKYAAYCYYKSKGWVVRSGLKFGSDFLLYEKGPANSHSLYSVHVRLWSNEVSEGWELENVWQYMFATSRVAGQVRKSLLVCLVKIPESSSDWMDLEKYEVHEISFARYDPNNKRL